MKTFLDLLGSNDDENWKIINELRTHSERLELQFFAMYLKNTMQIFNKVDMIEFFMDYEFNQIDVVVNGDFRNLDVTSEELEAEIESYVQHVYDKYRLNISSLGKLRREKIDDYMLNLLGLELYTDYQRKELIEATSDAKTKNNTKPKL